MSDTTIPISVARKIAETHGFDQVVVIARRVGTNGAEACTTYGRTKEHCTIAARIGEALQAGSMGWPGVLHPDAARLAIGYAFELDTPEDAMEFLDLWLTQRWAEIRQVYDCLPVNMLPKENTDE